MAMACATTHDHPQANPLDRSTRCRRAPGAISGAYDGRRGGVNLWPQLRIKHRTFPDSPGAGKSRSVSAPFGAPPWCGPPRRVVETRRVDTCLGPWEQLAERHPRDVDTCHRHRRRLRASGTGANPSSAWRASRCRRLRVQHCQSKQTRRRFQRDESEAARPTRRRREAHEPLGVGASRPSGSLRDEEASRTSGSLRDEEAQGLGPNQPTPLANRRSPGSMASDHKLEHRARHSEPHSLAPNTNNDDDSPAVAAHPTCHRRSA